MDVDAMDELMYDTLIRYFKTLAHTGYKSYDVVFKMLVMDFIYEITHTELRYYITNEDIKLIQDLLYQFFGSTCEVSLPTNRSCCECVCCDGGSSTPPPIVVPTTTTTTTSTRPPAPVVLLFKSGSIPYTATYNINQTVSVTDVDVSKTIAKAGIYVTYVINKIVCADDRWKVDKVIINGTATELPYSNNESAIIDPVFIPVGTTITTTTVAPAVLKLQSNTGGTVIKVTSDGINPEEVSLAGTTQSSVVIDMKDAPLVDA